ncbi:magnesium transporter CorA family protein [Candidatus Harpocratesius sp.]
MKMNYFILRKVVDNRPIVEQFDVTLDDLRDGMHPDSVKEKCMCCFLDINFEDEIRNIEDVKENADLLDLTVLLDISLDTLEEIIEDSRPRLDDYISYMLILFKNAVIHPSEREEKRENQIGLIIYENVAISIHLDEVINTSRLFNYFRKNPMKLIKGQITYLISRYMDLLIDQTIDVIDDWRKFAEEIELRILTHQNRTENEILDHLIGIRQSLFDTVKILQADREVLVSMTDVSMSHFDPNYIPRELDDHIRHEIDELDILRQNISDLMNLYFNAESSKLNQTLARFTFATSVLLVPTVISGIFGMNNPGFPSISFWVACGIMALSMGALWVYFKVKKLF